MARRSFRTAFTPSPAWLFAFVVFVGHQVLQRGFGVSLPFVDSYLDPFLSIPLLLGLVQAERQWLLGEEGEATTFNGWEIAGMTLALALLFEEGFPRWDDARQVRDGWDYVAYAIGGVVYWTVSRG